MHVMCLLEWGDWRCCTFRRLIAPCTLCLHVVELAACSRHRFKRHSSDCFITSMLGYLTLKGMLARPAPGPAALRQPVASLQGRAALAEAR